MVSSFTPNLNLNEPATGDLVGTWGSVALNPNLTSIDARFGSTAVVTLSNSNVTLTQTQINNFAIYLTGTLTANVTVAIPATIGGIWVFSNGTAGPYTVTIATTASGATIQTTQGLPTLIACDGTNIYYPDYTNIVNIASGIAAQYAAPPGVIIQFAAPTAPSGWVVCDGAAYSRTSYSGLFATIGTLWGTGDGSTTFNVPDFRGMFLRGWDAGAGNDLNTPGRTFASYEDSAFTSHNHGGSDLGHAHSTIFGGSSGGGFYGSGTAAGATNPSGTQTGYANIDIGYSGSPETTTQNYAVLYCIKT